MNKYQQDVLLSAFQDELEKLAYIGGEPHPRMIQLEVRPEDVRKKEFLSYAQDKAREKPTNLAKALGVGALVGAPLGGLFGLGHRPSMPAHAVAGGLLGAGMGALLRNIDADEVRSMREILQDKRKFHKELERRTVADLTEARTATLLG